MSERFHILSVRVSQDEKDALSKVARSANFRGLSSYIRDAALNDANRTNAILTIEDKNILHHLTHDQKVATHHLSDIRLVIDADAQPDLCEKIFTTVEKLEKITYKIESMLFRK